MLAVGVAIAFIPSKIAGDKGYSKVGFYAYGLFFFLPALIQVLTLPSRQDPTKKQFSPRGLKYLITATIMLQLVILYDLYRFVIYLPITKGTGALLSAVYELFTVALLISVILGRKYIFSMVVYALFAARGIYGLICNVIDSIGYKGEDYASAYLFSAGEALLSILAFALLFFIVYKYGYKADAAIESKPKLLFYAPAIIILAEGILNFFTYPYVPINIRVLLSIVYVFYFLSIFFLGKFYYEDNPSNETI